MTLSERATPPTLPTDAGMEVHWYFPGGFPGGDGDMFCEEYVTGDDVIDQNPSAVTCSECLEWMHA